MDTQGKPEPIVIQPQQNLQGEVQYPSIVQQPQIVYIELKYNPETNYRWWSYGVIALGVLIYLGSIFLSSGPLGDESVILISNSVCCLSFAAALFLDAAFYKGKSDWQESTGQSNSGSNAGMVIDIILGIIALFLALLILINL